MKKIILPALIIPALLLPFFSFAQVNVATNIITSKVELIWESHAYIPPLYAGKALYPTGGEVTVLALPPSSLGASNTLSYTWKKDGVVDGAQSGAGKRSFVFSGSQFGESPLITVEVTNGTETEFGSVRLTQTQPFIRLYENKPLEGITFEKTLPRTVSSKEQEINIEAYPFFFTAGSRADIPLQYTWSANGQKLSEAIDATLSVRTEEPGSVDIQLSLQNVGHTLQRATESIGITFE